MSDLLNSASLVMIPSGYKEDIVYSEVPTNGNGDLSFTRASNGTRVNSAGLVEVCPWNLADNSNDFGSLSLITKTTGQVSPIDSTSGNLLTATGSGEHYSGTASLTVVIGNSYTYSVYGKFVQNLQLALRTVFSNGDQDIATIWNLSTGALVANAGAHTNPTITAVGNGYYRCSITFTPTVVPAFPLLFRLQMALGGNTSFTASSGDSFLAYGAQINNGALAPYFPTTDRLNVPRLTYQNGGGGCPSLLLEKQSTNINTYSEDFSNVAYDKVNATITTNQTTSPDGTTNADKLTDDSTNDYHIVYPSTLSITASRVTTSVYLKNNDIQFGGIQLATTIGGTYDTRITIVVDLINGTITDTEQTGTPNATYSIENMGNGWYRLIVSADHVNGSVSNVVCGSNSGTPSNFTAALPVYVGTGKSLFLWGMQMEASSYPTSYIPTTSASATRVADLASVPQGTIANFGTDPFCVFLDVNYAKLSVGGAIALLGNRQGGSWWRIYGDGSVINLEVNGSNGYTTLLIVNSSQLTSRTKIAISRNGNNMKVYVNGSSVQNVTNVVYSSDFTTANSSVEFNAWGAGTYEITTTEYNEAVFFKQSLTAAELASLTTI